MEMASFSMFVQQLQKKQAKFKKVETQRIKDLIDLI